MKNPWIRRSLAVTGALLMGAAVVAAVEGGDTPAVNGNAEPPSEVGAGAGGLTVFRDPETRRLGPLPRGMRIELSRRLQEMISTSHERLEVRENPRTGMMVDLRGRFQSATMATVGEDGELHVGCIDGSHTHEAEAVSAASDRDQE